MARHLCIAVFFGLLIAPVHAASIRVAVASNFADTARILVMEFQRSSTHEVTLLLGSTGKHYAQILNGLPVDVLLAADNERPKLLEKSGFGVADTRFTYAIGRLVLWSAHDFKVGASSLHDFRGERIAIANPRLAPYGVAAQQVMQSMGVFETLVPMIVRGENVTQAYQFVATGNAQMGLVARSQMTSEQSGYWVVPKELHQPINQQAILLRKGVAAEAFMAFLRSKKALELIRVGGYDTP